MLLSITALRNAENEITGFMGIASDISARKHAAAEITRYAVDLRSMTGGRGRFSAEHNHYDVLPAHLVDKAKAARTNGR